MRGVFGDEWETRSSHRRNRQTSVGMSRVNDDATITFLVESRGVGGKYKQKRRKKGRWPALPGRLALL